MMGADEAAIFAAGGMVTPEKPARRFSLTSGYGQRSNSCSGAIIGASSNVGSSANSCSGAVVGSMTAPLSPDVDAPEPDEDGSSSSTDSLPSNHGGGETELASRLEPSGKGRQHATLNLHDPNFEGVIRALPDVDVEMAGPVAQERLRGTKSLRALTNGFRKMVWKDLMMKVRPGTLELYKPWYKAPGGDPDYMISRMLLSEAVVVGRLTDIHGGFWVGCRCRALGPTGVMCVQFKATANELVPRWIWALQRNAPHVRLADRTYDPKAAWVVVAHS